MTTEALTPVAPAERVESIDVLRGLALFGILAANIRGFAGPPLTYFFPHLFWPAWYDRLAQAFIDTFVQGKFITIFAFLFGVGFAVQLERARARGGRFGWIYTRRLLILVALGLIHGLLIWFGDILLMYGLIGLLLLAFGKRKDKTLVIWAVVVYLIPLVLALLYFAVAQAGLAPPMPEPTAAEIAKARAIYATGTWAELQRQRMSDALAHNWAYFPAIMWQILALFLLGMLAWRRRWLQPEPDALPRYRRIMPWALAVGIACNVAATALRWIFDFSMVPDTPAAMLAGLLQTFGVPALGLGYVCLVLILCHDPVWRARLQRFGAVGRTALTNYLLQSVIGTLLFYSYGLALFGKAGPALLLPLTFVLYAALTAASVWWVERFRFGPVEWLWRSLTYGRMLPLARERVSAAPAIAD